MPDAYASLYRTLASQLDAWQKTVPWGNVDYSTATKDLDYQQFTQQANRAVLQALKQGTFTPLGRAWAAAIR